MQRHVKAGLTIAGWLALLTFLGQAVWSSPQSLWGDPADTIRAHMNARTAQLMHGDLFKAIDECTWLRSHTHLASEREKRDIARGCPQ